MIRLHTRDPFKDIFDSFFEGSVYNTNYGINSYKSTNVSNNEKDYTVEVAVPGLTKEDLKISLEDNTLTISYEKEKNNKNYSFVSSFSKSYTLPEDSDDENISAKVENGILKIIIPKTKKVQKERLISLN